MLNHYRRFILFLALLLCPTWVWAQTSIIDTVNLVNDSLVTVKAVKIETAKSPQASAAIDPKTGRILVLQQGVQAKTEKNGAGVIIHPAGFIITNLHTVVFADKIYVILSNQKMLRAKLLKYLPDDDLALLQVSAPIPLTPIVVANSDLVRLGDRLINIGHSPLLRHTITEGLVNRLATKTWPDGHISVEYIQANMNLYKGDSGGPLLNENGYLVGMVMGRLRSQDKAAIAIPSNKLKNLYLGYIN